MNGLKKTVITLSFIFLTFLLFIQPAIAENNNVIVEFYYTTGCTVCNEAKPIINEIEQYYVNNITLQQFLVINDKSSDNYTKLGTYLEEVHVPTIVVKNQSNGDYTVFEWEDIDTPNFVDTLKDTIDSYIIGSYTKTSTDPNYNKDDENTSEDIQDTGTPGFEITIAFFAITMILFYKKRKQNI